MYAMVRLNKTGLSQKQLDVLFAQLNQTLGRLEPKQTSAFLSELLGSEERIMLAKRLAIIILLLEGKSLYNISHTLKVSPTTAEKVKFKLDSGHYKQILKTLGKNKTDYFAILEAIDDILHLGGILPHYNGLDRYRHL